MHVGILVVLSVGAIGTNRISTSGTALVSRLVVLLLVFLNVLRSALALLVELFILSLDFRSAMIRFSAAATSTIKVILAS